MSNEIINKEKEMYKQLYSKLMFSYDDLMQMLDEGELSKRTFISKVKTLKEYMEFLDKLEKESKKDKGFLKKLFSKDYDVEQKIDNYLTVDKKIDIEKLNKCSNCKCINCVSSCMINSCLNCRKEEYVQGCDKITSALTKTNETVTLYDNDKSEVVFNVAGYLVEKEDDNIYRYVYLIDSKDYDNQHLLRYSKFKGEESYDSVIVDDSQNELIRLNDKFIKLGLRV